MLAGAGPNRIYAAFDQQKGLVKMSQEIVKLQLKREFNLHSFSFPWGGSPYPFALFKRALGSMKKILSVDGFFVPNATSPFTGDQKLGTSLTYNSTLNKTVLTNYDETGAVDLVTEFAANLKNRLVADSSSATGSAEAIFSNGSYTLPANQLAKKVVRVRGLILVTGQNSTDTHTFQVRLGGLTGTSIYTSGALNLAANGKFEIGRAHV